MKLSQSAWSGFRVLCCLTEDGKVYMYVCKSGISIGEKVIDFNDTKKFVGLTVSTQNI